MGFFNCTPSRGTRLKHRLIRILSYFSKNRVVFVRLLRPIIALNIFITKRSVDIYANALQR